MSKLKTIALLTLLTTLSVTAQAEVMNRGAFDPNAGGYQDQISMAGEAKDITQWEPAKLPPHVIPAIKVIDTPRNQKVRMTQSMFTVQDKVHKLHAPVAMKVYKVHPTAIKTVKVVKPAVTQTIPSE